MRLWILAADRVTEEQIIKMLRAYCATQGSQVAAAARLGVSVQHVNDILHGHRKPGPKILKALGLKKVVSYVRQEVEE